MRLKPLPDRWDRRVVTRFAFFPTVVADGSRVWLELYRSHQKWVDAMPWHVGWLEYRADAMRRDKP